jgi:hypothetical protein
MAQGLRCCLTHRMVVYAVVSEETRRAIELFPTRDEAEEMLTPCLTTSRAGETRFGSRLS